MGWCTRIEPSIESAVGKRKIARDAPQHPSRINRFEESSVKHKVSESRIVLILCVAVVQPVICERVPQADVIRMRVKNLRQHVSFSDQPTQWIISPAGVKVFVIERPTRKI